MRTQLVFIPIIFLALGFGCGKVDPYSYDYAGALRYQSDSSREEAFVVVVGQTNGPFKSLGAICLLPDQGGKFVAGAEGAASSWTAPARHKELYRGYQFEDPLKRRMIVVKSVMPVEPLTNQMQRTGQ